MKIKLKFLTLTFISLFFSKLVFAETAPGFNSWDDVVKAADGGQVNVYMWVDQTLSMVLLMTFMEFL